MDLGLNDTKPDISQLSISSSSSSPFAGIGTSHYIGSSGVSSTQGFGYGMSSHGGGSMTGGGFYDGGGMFGGISNQALPSSMLHSQSSMSPGQYNSPTALGIGSASGTPSMSGFSSPMQSPTSSVIGGSGGSGSNGSQLGSSGSSSNLLIGNTKHICAICGDRASGKHYGVYSCEGCKGFFKRTVRKELQYACRDEKNCIVDKRQRNRCQYCRYQKCLNMGMKREAVQEERQRAREKGEVEVESTTSANSEMPVEMILEAELAADSQMDICSVDVQGVSGYGDRSFNSDVMNQAMDRQLIALVDWAKRIPHFTELQLDDQVTLLRAGWNELLIAGFSHQSVMSSDSILLAMGLHIYRNTAQQVGIGSIFDRILSELVSKMREMAMDKSELGCLRAIVLFNPDAKGISMSQSVESLREKVYATLDEHCKQHYPDEPGRFAKLLLRLPALRSIGLKCTDHLFTSKLIGDVSLDTFLYEMLENPNPSS